MPVHRPANFGRLSKNQESFIFHCEYINTFFGCAAINLLVYSWVSPYWFMINPRLSVQTPETRVLGPSKLLESSNRINMSFLWASDTVLTGYRLSERMQGVCQGVAEKQDEAGRETWHETGLYWWDQFWNGFHGANGCGIDCEDMELFGNLSVPCNHQGESTDSFAIPMPPAHRLAHCSRATVRQDTCDEGTKTPCNMMLKYGCQEKPDKEKEKTLCPIGYKKCPVSSSSKACPALNNMKKGFREFTCCLDSTDIGKPLYNVTEAPTYVQVFGYMQWQLQHGKSASTEPARWCSVRSFRCHTLFAFKESGQKCLFFLITASSMLLVAVLLGFSRFRQRFILFTSILYFLAGGTASLGLYTFEHETQKTLKLTMTEVDVWGRPYLHPVDRYQNSYGDRPWSIYGEIEDESKSNETGNPEFAYYSYNARVDFTARHPEYKPGYRKLWGFYMGAGSCVLCFIACIGSLEVYFAYKNASPIISALQFVGILICFVPYGCRVFIDNYLAPYPVLWVYPWQKLYPKAFTVGTWLPEPFDMLYDCGLMMPVHICRALWDYVSCQDICSPQEKRVLAKKGIINDRLQSLLCSRRSYFVMMAGMGILGFFVKLNYVIHLSQYDMRLRQATSEEVSYPIYRCKLLQGDCALGMVPDVASLSSYLHHMAWRIYAVLEEGYNIVHVKKVLIEWTANFVGVCCACGAVANWTDFKQSRRFCIIGWLIMVITPVLTCAYNENSHINRKGVQDAIIKSAEQTWEEVFLFVQSNPCPKYKEWANDAVGMGEKPCHVLVDGVGKLIPGIGKYRDGCKVYLEQLRKYRAEADPYSMSEMCEAAVQQLKLVVPIEKKQVTYEIHKVMPYIMDGITVAVGARSGMSNMLQIIPAVASMVPGLMQGGLMFKNVVPRQTLPAILTTLPWAFTTVFWSQYQAAYQILTHKLLLTAALAMSFCPLVYYVYGKIYNLVQPMDDQQSITVTFRLWYYALIFALVLPYAVMLVYLAWLNDYQSDLIWQATVGKVMNNLASFISGTFMMYAYTLQAGIDWFVDEIVDMHVCYHAPAVLAMTETKEQADELQERMHTWIDTESIDQGTYVCGGLSDPNMLEPPKEGDWNSKAKVYVCSLANKDAATLDAFAMHIKNDKRLGDVLRRARQPFWQLMDNPPREIYVWDERSAAAAEEVQQRCRQGAPQPEPVVGGGQAQSVEMPSMGHASASTAGWSAPQMRQPLQQQMQPPGQSFGHLQPPMQSFGQQNPMQQFGQAPMGSAVGPTFGQPGMPAQFGQPHGQPFNQSHGTGMPGMAPFGGPLGRIG